MATYNIDITSKAIKYFENLNRRIVAMHCKLEPATDADSIKCITNYLHNGYGNWLAIGGKSKEMKFRYIRIVIDVMAGSETASLKEELMRGTLECCMMYEGKKAEDCEVEIRWNEVKEECVMRFAPKHGL